LGRNFQRGGCKRIVAADGSALVQAKKPEPVGMLVKALARAWRWHKERVSLSYTQRAAAPCH
jgi:hypothetical protein